MTTQHKHPTTAETLRPARWHWLDTAAVGTLGTALAAGLLVPADVVQGELSRLMYVHVPAAWLAYLAFLVTLAGSVAYLVTRRMRWDRLAAASAEAGVFFSGLTLLLGMVWGKPVWLVWWTWEARLVLTAVMFFVYLGYLALRRVIDEPELRAKRSAVFGILAVVQIPLVHFSVVWWRSLHQQATVLRPDADPQIDPPLFAALIMGVVAFMVVYAALLRRRMHVSRLEAAVRSVDDGVSVAGDAVVAPGSATVEAAPSRATHRAPALIIPWILVAAAAVVAPFLWNPSPDNQWAWVSLGYVATYASLIVYARYLWYRSRVASRVLAE